ncbi:MAG: hypothetical protein ACE5E0_00600 [Terriglobia bacterium]
MAAALGLEPTQLMILLLIFLAVFTPVLVFGTFAWYFVTTVKTRKQLEREVDRLEREIEELKGYRAPAQAASQS